MYLQQFSAPTGQALICTIANPRASPNHADEKTVI